MPKFPNPRYHYEMSPKSNYQVDIVTHKCDICEEKFITLNDLKKHNESHTKVDPKKRRSKPCYETQPVRRSPRVSKPNKKFIGYDSDVCSKSYNRVQTLNFQKTKFHQEVLPKCDASKIVFIKKTDFDKQNIITDKEAKKPSNLQNQICLKSEDGDEKSQLSTCQKKHDLNVQLPKWASSGCAQLNKKGKDVRMNLQPNKFKKRMHKCNLCKKSFFKRISLRRHHKFKHNKTNANTTESTSTKTELTSTKAESTSTKAETTSTKVESTSTKAESTSTMAESTSTNAETTSTKVESTSTKAESTSTMAESTSTKSSPPDPQELIVLRNLYTRRLKFDCDICDDICDRPDHLDIYLWTHSNHPETLEKPGTRKTFPCYVCYEPLATLELKKAHELDHIRTIIF